MIEQKPDIDRKYQDRLRSIPAPGAGCHPELLGVANLGIIAGRTPDVIFADIREAVPSGTRRLSDREIHDAIHKAHMDCKPVGGSYQRYRPVKVKPRINDGEARRGAIIAQASVSDEADLWESSRIRIDWTPEQDPAVFIGALFDPEDYLFIGDRIEPGIIGKNIRRAADWIKFFQSGGQAGPFIIVNPLSGRPEPKKTGDGETFRGDSNVSSYRYALAEFDTLSREDQIRFWTSAKLSIAALVDSGGKSIHAWLRMPSSIKTAADWQTQIKHGLYDKALIPMGVDSACSNPARLARLPGVLRDTGRFQKILWLNAEIGGNLQ